MDCLHVDAFEHLAFVSGFSLVPIVNSSTSHLLHAGTLLAIVISDYLLPPCVMKPIG